MRDDQTEMRMAGGDTVVVRFASRVVALLALRAEAEGHALREDLVVLLEVACTNDDPGRLAEALAEFRRQKVPAALLADRYIPDAARRLGTGWLDDRLTFAEVSVGAARLQSILREIGAHWAGDAGDVSDAGEILLIVPAGEQHTLGAIVALGQLRRMGVSVCLRFGPDHAELASLLRGRRFDGVFLSVSCTEKLEACRRLVATIRKTSANRVPVVIGGAVMGLVGDAAQRTGADLATDSLELGLQACDLMMETRAPRRMA